ncbi:hypothetical protein QTP88_001319 [Uroleucon formosanum]
MANGENVLRNWLLYSKSLNRVFCLYCRLFPSKSTSSLASIGFSNWKQISERLKEHELSIPHNMAQEKRIQLRMGLDLHKTVDNNIQDNLNIEKERWRSILKRIIACIEFLAEHNDAFRGTNSKLYTPNNGKFLGLIQMIAKFDIIIADHLRRVCNDEIHDHYLGPRIQNELISIIATKIRDEIINRVKQSKYFTILLDGTPDKSHKEQLTFLLRIVEISKNLKYEINEYFICFIHTSNKSGSNLTEEIKEQLQLMNLDLKNCRGQAYDNGANMVGRKQGVQSRIISENPRAFFVPCTAHSLNLLLGDMASSVPAAMTFFGVIQRIYTMFSASTERWTILLKYVSDFTLKSMSDTRWESRVESIKPIRFQLGQVHDALVEVSELTKDPKIKSESLSLANYEFSYDFILSVVICYELLSAINKVKKGFELSKKTAQQLCEDIGTQPIFKQSRVLKKSKQFDYECNDTRAVSNEQKFYQDYFLAVVDQAIVSINQRFEQLSQHSENFGFLYNI